MKTKYLLLAVAALGGLFTAVRPAFAQSWKLSNAPTEDWQAVASSADGCKLVGSAYPGRLFVYFGGIYTARITPAPQLNLTCPGNGFKLSWVVPSTNFVVQQSSDLSSWTDVTNASVLNLTNLQNEVTFPLTGSNAFYRLKTP